MALVLGSIGSTVNGFLQAAREFFERITQLNFGWLALALALFFCFTLARSIASYNSLRAAYPDERFQWRRVWGAYVAAFGVNQYIPAGGGSVVQLVLVRNSIANSNYSTVASALVMPVLFDAVMCAAILGYAFTQGVFPKPKDFGGLQSFDISFFGNHPNLTIFIATAIVVLVLTLFAVLSVRIQAFWKRVRQGTAVLRDRRRYLLGMCLPQFVAWTLRMLAYWAMLAAFHIGGSLHNAILVLAVVMLAMLLPVTPGGAGAQQALLVVIFSSTGPTDSIAIYAVGQQIAIALFMLALGFGAVFFIFRYRSLRQVLRESRATHKVERARERDQPSGEAEEAELV